MNNSDKISKAILKINPNAKYSFFGEDINSIIWNNGTTPISKTDIEAQMLVVEQEEIDAQAKKIADKASANTKLRALGLTDDEIEAFKS